MSRPTIYDVAKLCNVSATTVSLTIRGKGRISEKTRDRIFSAIESLGYTYNQAAANLSNKKNNYIGLVLHDITNPVYNQLTAGVSNKFDENNFLLFLANCESSASKQQRFIESLLNQNASGIIICPAKGLDTKYLHSLKRRNIPVVFAVRSLDIPEYDFVGIDNFQGAQMATEHLLKLGHKHIGFIGNLHNSKTASHRVSGYIGKLMENGIEVNHSYITKGDNSSRKSGYQQAMLCLINNPEITALICYTDTMAYGAMRAIQEKHLVVGKDIAVIGFDDLPESVDSYPSLTSVTACAQDLGNMAATTLLERINGSDEPPKKIILSPQLVIRSSSG